MLKPLLAATLFAGCFVASAIAQDTTTPAPDAAPLPAVDTLTCEQMQAEMMTAGQRMNSQLDPQFGVEAQAMANDAQQRQRSAMTQGMGMSALCMIPGAGAACMAAQQAQIQQAQRDAAANQGRMQAQMDRLDASMEGIDQQRMMAISDRWESQHCQAPQQ